MTQIEAQNAVKHIEHQIKELKNSVAAFDRTSQTIINNLLDDIHDFLRELETRKQATPNCRRVTREELEALCNSSNVVMFPAAA